MAVTVKLYGRLRKVARQHDSLTGTIGIVKLSSDEVSSASDLIKRIGLDRGEISHIFINGSYSGVNKKIEDKDRIAMFPDDMGLLYSWYFEEEE